MSGDYHYIDDYKSYRRQFRKEMPGSKNYMEYHDFAGLCEREEAIDKAEYDRHIRIEGAVWRFS